jgi:hypothetical protein
MRLIDLEPAFLGSGGTGVTDREGRSVPHRAGVGVRLKCPCGCASPLYVPFKNPISGGAENPDGWHRVGDAFETLTLTPSIQRASPKGCRWHGFITNGQIIKA